MDTSDYISFAAGVGSTIVGVVLKTMLDRYLHFEQLHHVTEFASYLMYNKDLLKQQDDLIVKLYDFIDLKGHERVAMLCEIKKTIKNSKYLRCQSYFCLITALEPYTDNVSVETLIECVKDNYPKRPQPPFQALSTFIQANCEKIFQKQSTPPTPL